MDCGLRLLRHFADPTCHHNYERRTRILAVCGAGSFRGFSLGTYCLIKSNLDDVRGNQGSDQDSLVYHKDDIFEVPHAGLSSLKVSPRNLIFTLPFSISVIYQGEHISDNFVLECISGFSSPRFPLPPCEEILYTLASSPLDGCLTLPCEWLRVKR